MALGPVISVKLLFKVNFHWSKVAKRNSSMGKGGVLEMNRPLECYIIAACWRRTRKNSSLASIVSSLNMAVMSLSFKPLGICCKGSIAYCTKLTMRFLVCFNFFSFKPKTTFCQLIIYMHQTASFFLQYFFFQTPLFFSTCFV